MKSLFIFWSFLFFVLSPFAAPASALGPPTKAGLDLFDCRQGDLDACVEYSLFVGYPEPYSEQLEAQLRLARSAYGQACKSTRDHEACARHAVVSLILRDHTAEHFDQLTRACDANIGWACPRIAEFLQAIDDGDASQKQIQSFEAYYKTLGPLCARGNQGACVNQSRLNPHLPNIVMDSAIWYDQAQSACDDGMHRACTHLGYLLSIDANPIYRANLDHNALFGINSLERISRRLSLRGCELGNGTGCYNYGLDLLDLDINGQDPWRVAQSYFARACLLGENEGCFEINWESYWRATDRTADLSAACKAGDFSACAHQVSNAYSGKFKPLRDAPSSDEYVITRAYVDALSALCVQGSAQACGWAGAVLWQQQHHSTEGERLAFAGCSPFVQNGNACHVLGRYYEFNRNSPDHLTRAALTYETGCENDDPGACASAGYMFLKGRGVALSVAKALRYFELGCDERHARSCYLLAQNIAETHPARSKFLHDQACRINERFCEAR